MPELTANADDLCAHGCGDDATVQSADGCFLCYPCYRTETGGDNEPLPGCPTCSPEHPAAQDRAREGAQRLAEGESADRGSALDGTGEPRPTHAVVSPDAGSAAYRRPVPPQRECRGGCGRKRRTWSESWLCRFCLLADRAASPLSMREWRKQRERDRLAG